MQTWVRLAWRWSRPVSVHLEDRLELLRSHSSLPSMSLFWRLAAVIAVLCSTLTGCVCYHTYSLLFHRSARRDAEMTPAQCWVKVLKSWIIGFENERFSLRGARVHFTCESNSICCLSRKIKVTSNYATSLPFSFYGLSRTNLCQNITVYIFSVGLMEEKRKRIKDPRTEESRGHYSSWAVL